MTNNFALSFEDLVLECFLLIRNDIMDIFKWLLCDVKERFVELIVFDVDKHEFLGKRKLKECFILLPDEFERHTILVKFCMHDRFAINNFLDLYIFLHLDFFRSLFEVSLWFRPVVNL